jgi:hypothetical protein
MKRTQLSVLVENRPGRLLALLESLSRVGMDIEATCVMDAGDFGLPVPWTVRPARPGQGTG